MKKNLLIFISGLLVATTICVGASILYNAKDIEYKDTNVQNAIDDLYENLVSADLLWTNPNPYSAFNTSKIELDLTDYEYIVVDAFQNNSSAGNYGYLHKNLYAKGISNQKLLGPKEYSSRDYNITFRKISIDDTGINLSSSGVYGSGATLTQSSTTFAVPYHVWGIKNLELK